jgi:hypothetical protein
VILGLSLNNVFKGSLVATTNFKQAFSPSAKPRK